MAGTYIVYDGYFKDDNDNDCKVYIKKAGYEGAETEVTMGDNPVIIKWVGSDDDKFAHIKSKEAYIEFESTTPLMFLSMFTEPAKTYEVEIYRGSTLVFVGFVNPEYYTEPFEPGPHIVTIHAIDGLAELKNINLSIPGYTDGDWRQTIIYYVHSCLSQIGYEFTNMDYEVAISLVANTTTDGLISARLFEYLYFDYRSLQDDDGEFLSCYDVLDEICATFNARLYQNGDAWRIERLDQKYDDFRLELYDDSGTYSSTTAAQNEEVVLTSHKGRGSDIRFIRGASLEVQPAYKKYSVVQDYGKRENILNTTSWGKMFTWNDWTDASTLRFWSTFGTMDYVYSPSKFQDDDGYEALRIKGIYTSGSNYIFSTGGSMVYTGVDNLDNLIYGWANGDVSLVLSYEVRKSFNARREINNFLANLQLWANFSGTFYRAKNEEGNYVNILGQQTDTRTGLTIKSYNKNSAGSFTPEVNADTIIIDLADTNDWENVLIEFKAPPDDEVKTQSSLIFTVRLFPCATNLSAGDVTDDDGLLYRNLKLFFKSNLGDGTRSNNRTIDEDNILEPDNYEYKFGDTPSPIQITGRNDAYGATHKHVIYDSGGIFVNRFAYAGATPPFGDTLYETVLPTDLNVTYRRPQFKLKGTVIDTTTPVMDFTTCLKDYNSRWYIPLSMSHDMRRVTYEGEWLQIWDESGTGEFNDDFSKDFFI